MRVFLHIWSHQIVNTMVHICLIHLPTIFNRFNFTVHDLVYFILGFTQTRLVGCDKKGIYPVSVELLYCLMTESLSVWNGRYNKSHPLEPWWLIIPSVSTIRVRLKPRLLESGGMPVKVTGEPSPSYATLCDPISKQCPEKAGWELFSTDYCCWSRKASKHWRHSDEWSPSSRYNCSCC